MWDPPSFPRLSGPPRPEPGFPTAAPGPVRRTLLLSHLFSGDLFSAPARPCAGPQASTWGSFLRLPQAPRTKTETWPRAGLGHRRQERVLRGMRWRRLPEPVQVAGEGSVLGSGRGCPRSEGIPPGPLRGASSGQGWLWGSHRSAREPRFGGQWGEHQTRSQKQEACPCPSMATCSQASGPGSAGGIDLQGALWLASLGSDPRLHGEPCSPVRQQS